MDLSLLGMIYSAGGRGGGSEPTLLPCQAGLSDYFDYQHNLNVNDKTWGSMYGDRILTNSRDIIENNECLSLSDMFIYTHSDDVYAYTIYTISQYARYINGWYPIIGTGGSIPQFNLCNNTGKLAIGSGHQYGQYNSSIPSYGEWHVCCIALNNNYGAFYVDGEKLYQYYGYYTPRFGGSTNITLGIGSSAVNMKMTALCIGITHGPNAIKTNSIYLKEKYNI